jgi:AraC-like DNA-binding protein
LHLLESEEFLLPLLKEKRTMRTPVQINYTFLPPAFTGFGKDPKKTSQVMVPKEVRLTNSDASNASLARIDARLKRSTAYIEANLGAPITIKDMARAAGMSVFHFSRRFRRDFGVPPHRYLLRRRVEHSMQLLFKTDLTITEIAFRVGYQNISHFTALFRREVGTTPGRFKNRFRAQPGVDIVAA